MKKICLVMALLLFLLSCVACSKKRYDTVKLEKLFEEKSDRDVLYWADGSTAETRNAIILKKETDDSKDLMIRLLECPRDNGRSDYKLYASLHDRTLVSGYIAAFSFTYTFFNDSDLQRHTAYTQVNCFKGEESVNTLFQQAWYSVADLKLENGYFVSCTFTPTTIVGQKKEPGFILPEEDTKYLENLIKLCFDAATSYLGEQNVPLFY